MTLVFNNNVNNKWEVDDNDKIEVNRIEIDKIKSHKINNSI